MIMMMIVWSAGSELATNSSSLLSCRDAIFWWFKLILCKFCSFNFLIFIFFLFLVAKKANYRRGSKTFTQLCPRLVFPARRRPIIIVRIFKFSWESHHRRCVFYLDGKEESIFSNMLRLPLELFVSSSTKNIMSVGRNLRSNFGSFFVRR